MAINVGDPLPWQRDDDIVIPVFASSNEYDGKVNFTYANVALTAPVSKVRNVVSQVSAHVADFTNGRPKCPGCSEAGHLAGFAQMDNQGATHAPFE